MSDAACCGEKRRNTLRATRWAPPGAAQRRIRSENAALKLSVNGFHANNRLGNVFVSMTALFHCCDGLTCL